jgi:steroid 5-alpha reductase family enzyme
MDVLHTYLIIGLVILVSMTVLWLASLALRNSGIADVFWGAGFVVTTWVVFALTPAGFQERKLLISSLVSIWGLRLTLHILLRNRGKPEDFRYRAWRAEAGKSWWWRSFFKVFLLQGLLMWIIGAPLLAAQHSAAPDRFTLTDYAAIAVWIAGFFFEAVGDWQLARFKANSANKGGLMNTGVWRCTRHPNYFGDAAQWWGFYLAALAAGGWWTIFAPVIMTVLLVRVSGVVLLEKSLKETKPGYKEYVETTNGFFPWFPRSKKNPAGLRRSTPPRPRK